MALDATIGGSTSNSYVTLEYANALFADRLYADLWNAATEAIKQKALVTATRRIDEEQFRGQKVSLTQNLKWPRYNAYDEDGFPFAIDAIPERVKQATCMVALELLRTDFLAEDGLDNISFLSNGPIQVSQFNPTSPGALPAEAKRLLRIVMISGSGGGRTVRA